MASTAGVGPHPTQIQGTYSPTVSIQNVGPGDVFLGTDGSLTADNGWLLPAHAMGTWTGGAQLWAVTASGQSALRIADSALTYFTPGPDHVTVDGGTVNIGNATVPISGTVDIASGTVNAQITGPVSINGSTVNVGNAIAAANDFRSVIMGATALGSQTINFAPTASGSTRGTGGNIKTLNIQTFGNNNNTPTNRVATVTVAWVDPVSGNAVASDVCAIWLDGGFDWIIPARSQYFQIQWGNVPAGVSLNSLNVNVANADYPRSYSSSPSIYGGSFVQGGSTVSTINGYVPDPTGFSVWDVTSPAADTGYSQVLVPSRSGLCTWTVTKNAVTTATVEFKPLSSTFGITAASATVSRFTDATNFASGQMVLPEAPIIVQVRDTATSANKRFYGALSWSH